MPFLLYTTSITNNGIRSFHDPLSIKLAGSTGPIAKYVQSNAPLIPIYEWHLSETDILIQIKKDPENYSIIFDIKPKDKKNVSMMRLKDIWGYSTSGWTPMLLRLETLFVDDEIDNPAEFKLHFDHKASNEDNVYEFLYMQGDHKGGTWNWGLVGRVNGTLLWKDALEYFIRILKENGISG